MLLSTMPALSADKGIVKILRSKGDNCAIEQIWLSELKDLQTSEVGDAKQKAVNQSKLFEVLRELIRVEVVLNKLPEAEAYARRALELTHQPGFHVVDTLWMQHELAQLEEVQMRACEAGQNYSAELALRLKTHGELNPLSLHSWRDLALNLESQENYCGAYLALLQELTILQKVEGPSHFGLAGIYMDLGRLSYKLNNLERSVILYKKALSLLCCDPVGNKLMINQAQRELRRSNTRLASGNCPMN